MTILLVEDHDDSRLVLSSLLTHCGHEVATAANVRDALLLLNNLRFDILVSDIGLPDGSGLDLMQQLRARYNMKGIALSGYGMDDDVRRSLAAGFRSHLTKPVTADALFGAIEQVSRDAIVEPSDVSSGGRTD